MRLPGNDCCASLGRPPARHAADDPFQIVLCDVMLPGLDGISLCRRIREASTTPVVLISARTESIDIVSGLEAGADDYVTKPFDIQVLLARLRSVARRSLQPVADSAATGSGGPSGAEDHLRIGDLDLDVKVAGLSLGLPTPVDQVVAAIVANAASPIDALLSSILATLGIGLGQADVWALGIRCDGAVLVN